MLELLQGILLGVIIAMLFVAKYFMKGFIEQIKTIQNNLVKIAGEQQELSKDLINFIDKNIKERVIYSSTDAPYTNDHKFEEDKQEEEDDDEFQPPEDLTPEQLQDQMEGKNKQ